MKATDPQKIEEAIRIYQSGKTVDEAADITSISASPLRRALAARSIQIRETKRWIDKDCLCCGEPFTPTGSRQLVCDSQSCKLWRLAHPEVTPKYLRTNGPHGIYTRYVGGCRCVLCTEANNEHKRHDRHKMTRYQYAELLAIQDGSCALCNGPQIETSGAYDVDHSHACQNHTHQSNRTDSVRFSCIKCWRGLLCRPCNQQLERLVGHAYLREVEGNMTEEDYVILDYVRNPPANVLRSRRQNRTDDNEPSRDQGN